MVQRRTKVLEIQLVLTEANFRLAAVLLEEDLHLIGALVRLHVGGATVRHVDEEEALVLV